MEKWRLLKAKKDFVSSKCAYGDLSFLRTVLDDEDLQHFSLTQLEVLCDIVVRYRSHVDSCCPFETLGQDYIYHKQTGDLIKYDAQNHTAKIVDIDEIKNTAYNSAYNRLTSK